MFGLERYELHHHEALQQISRDRKRGDYTRSSLRALPTPHRTFLRYLANTESIAELQAMMSAVRRDIDPSYNFALGIGHNGEYHNGIELHTKPSHVVSFTEFDAEFLKYNPEREYLLPLRKRLVEGGRKIRIVGPIFIHDMHNIITHPFIAETSEIDHTWAHEDEKIQIGKRMLLNHQIQALDYPVTIISMPERNIGQNSRDDYDSSLTHRMLFDVSDGMFYRSIEVDGKRYGLYYLTYGSGSNLTMRALLYWDQHHLELFRPAISTWNHTNFPREVLNMSPEYLDISAKQTAEMVIENVTAYRRIFKAELEYRMKFDQRRNAELLAT